MERPLLYNRYLLPSKLSPDTQAHEYAQLSLFFWMKVSTDVTLDVSTVYPYRLPIQEAIAFVNKVGEEIVVRKKPVWFRFAALHHCAELTEL
ncbi:uncharacterized protein PITG_19836 [Phytophthora infestans T30-4]|uniref:Uncharacterized protein n=1 Tax=Phytophthora infestans (strain T30-4) TaxID=403677 RepID=D0P0V8_PHYIT|nr:uncharacterized protein PITG_19836 [Phytophthora infestans T30-4]EEY53665.1 hypothetical protein PITG_19836 [Phytophthora infestans T30-4]|eukprot:XP_002896051.1 hypothetical protein PITG_19836 [Phytophthora infestans T30-4]